MHDVQGIFVSRVVNGGPCCKAGLRAGDKLLSVSLLCSCLLVTCIIALS